MASDDIIPYNIPQWITIQMMVRLNADTLEATNPLSCPFKQIKMMKFALDVINAVMAAIALRLAIMCRDDDWCAVCCAVLGKQ